MNFRAKAEKKVFSLILGPKKPGPPRLLPLYLDIVYLTISKRIRSNPIFSAYMTCLYE